MRVNIKLTIIALLCTLLLLSITLAQNYDQVTINVNVTEEAIIEITPDTATFNQVTPGDVIFQIH